MNKVQLFLPCAGGVEPLLAAEVQRLLAADAKAPPLKLSSKAVEATRGGVWVQGDERSAMLLNLESRLAQRVLWPLAQAPYRDELDLYQMARSVNWEHWITPDQTLKVDVAAQRSPLRSLNFAALRIKDAVCDSLRESLGARPSVDTHRPDLPLALYVGPTHAVLYVDTSGEPLFKRGWREDTGEAPLKETLAAAMLAAADWQGRRDDGPLLDPCCGAGTIAIEAAQMACGIAAGALRHFAFERLLPFRAHASVWREMQRAAEDRVHAPAAPVFAGDVSFRMTDFATRNAERAGVRHAIDFKTGDAQQRPPPAPAGTMLINPPYGERMDPKGQGQGMGRRGDRGGDISQDRGEDRGRGSAQMQPPQARARQAFQDAQGDTGEADFYAGLASQWKRHYSGWTAWLLSPDPKLPSLLRLKESRRVPMWNGNIECRLMRFEISAGPGPGSRALAAADGGSDREKD